MVAEYFFGKDILRIRAYSDPVALSWGVKISNSTGSIALAENNLGGNRLAIFCEIIGD